MSGKTLKNFKHEDGKKNTGKKIRE